MSFNINIKELAEQVGKEMFPGVLEDFRTRFKNSLKNSLTPYFMTRGDRQHFKDNPSLLHRFGITKDNINDIGMVDDMIQSHIESTILSEETKKYMEKYINDNFKKHLDDALDEAMKRQAKKLAFTTNLIKDLKNE